MLGDAGFDVLSEESGPRGERSDVLVVVDPLDGSTNAARGIPWYATSLCAVDADGPLVALVVNLVNGVRYEAVRGGGALRDGEPIGPSGATALGRSVIGLSGYPPRALGWGQYRALGAAALDLCAVADGVLDGYVDCSRDAHGSWDYLGGALGVPRGRRAHRRCSRPRSRDHRVLRSPDARRRGDTRAARRPPRRQGHVHVIERVHRLLLQIFRRLPARARRAAVHAIAPSYYVGAIALVERDDGARLFVRHTYRRRWGVPGGLVARGEDPRDAVRREAREEVGLRIELVGEPAVVVDPETRRVDVIFAARPAAGEDPSSVAPRSPEIAECRWFAADDLPPLQHETAGALVVLARRLC